MPSDNSETAVQSLLLLFERDSKLHHENIQTLITILQKLNNDRKPITYGPITINGGEVHLGDRYGCEDTVESLLQQAQTTNAPPFTGLPTSNNIAQDFLDARLSLCPIDHTAILRALASYSFANHSLSRVSPFWLSQTFAKWNSAATSTQIFLRAPFKDRYAVRAFCVEAVQQLMSRKIVVLHILSDLNKIFTLQDVLSSLINQMVKFGCFCTSTELSSAAARLQSARIHEDYINTLALMISNVTVAFIVVNTEAMAPEAALLCRTVLCNLRKAMESCGSNTLLRIIVTCHSPNRSGGTPLLPNEEMVKIDDRKDAHMSLFALRKAASKRTASDLDLLKLSARQSKRRPIRRSG